MGMMPMPLIRSAQTEGGQQPPAPPSGAAAPPESASDLIGQGQPQQSPQAEAQARMQQVKDLSDQLDALTGNVPEVAREAQDVKQSLKRLMLAMVRNSNLGGAAQPPVLG